MIGRPVSRPPLAFTNSGTYTISNSTAVITNTGIDFANSGALILDGSGAQGGSTLSVSGTLSNTGVLTIGQNNGLHNATNLTASVEIYASHFVNSGAVNLFSSLGSANQAWLNDTPKMLRFGMMPENGFGDRFSGTGGPAGGGSSART